MANNIIGGDNYLKARDLVMRYGWNTTCFQIVNPGIEYWFGDDGESVVGYATASGVRVVAGAPVCPEDALLNVTLAFENDSKTLGLGVCYFGAEARLETLLRNDPDHAHVLLGAQPVWHPSEWKDVVARHSSIRAQINRARNKGLVITEWPIEKAHDNIELRACLHAWLASKGLPPLHFLVEPETLARLYDRRVFVATRGEEVIGFVLLSPVATRNGWLFEQFVHRPKAPNGTVELMIDAAMRELAKEGCDYATLGLSPLSSRAPIEPFDNPFWLRVLLAWMRKHAQRFYNFDGLDAFKAKLQPAAWEPVFAIYNRPRISPRMLYAIASVLAETSRFTSFSAACGGRF